MRTHAACYVQTPAHPANTAKERGAQEGAVGEDAGVDAG
jgi:hypothetical protein